MTADANGIDPILDALQEQFGGMIVQYVVIANVINEDGESTLAVDSFENQRNHTTLGLLAWGVAVEQHQAVQAFVDGED